MMGSSCNLVDVDGFIESATREEKIALLSGQDFWHTTSLPEYGIPAVRCTDGPNGVRGTRFFNPVPSVCIPCGTGLGATWNEELIEQAGQLLSKECSAKGAHVWLGPTINICRSPLNGRGFECMSEDPYLSGVLAGAIIRGVQSRGTLAAVKHFVANDQETEKTTVDVRMSERALREIYLKPFQIAIREGNPRVLMASYNKVNGSYTSESKELLQDIVRCEWGFDGLIMSDWYGTYSGAASLEAGLDIEMPGPSRYRSPKLLSNVSSDTVDYRVREILQFVNEASLAPVDSTETTRDKATDRVLNHRLASESVVLLKNENEFLPLKAEDCKEVAIIGPNAKLSASCGGGSAGLRAYYTSSVYEGIKRNLPKDTKINHESAIYDHDLLPLLSDGLLLDESNQFTITAEFFSQPYGVKGRQPFDSADIPSTSYQLMDYCHPDLPETFYISMSTRYVPAKTGLYEFGLASYGISDLYINDQRIIDNSSTQRPNGMFFGKGSVEERGVFRMEAGKEYCLRVEAGSASTSKATNASKMPIPGGACRLGGSIKLGHNEGIENAVELARRCKHTFVVVGLHGDIEKEGKDRTTIEMPPHTDELVEAVLAVNPDAVIITQAGQPVMMPWRARAKSMIHSWYGGNEAGNAVADVIFGHVNPSGRLPVTFPARIEDCSSYLSFGSDNGQIYYSDDIFVGYRHYEARKIEVAFPFCHGLSYTTFALTDLRLTSSMLEVEIENTGARKGAEVLQVYISRIATPLSKPRFARPPRSLAGFQKPELQPGEKQCISVPINRNCMAVWDEKRTAWCCEQGKYCVEVVAGSSSLRAELLVQDDEYWTGL